jgi:hypothetical protein
VVSSGVKLFEKNSQSTRDMSGAEYRLSQDGAAMFEPFMTKRKVTLTGEEMAKFIHGGTFYRRSVSAIEFGDCARRLCACFALPDHRPSHP